MARSCVSPKSFSVILLDCNELLLSATRWRWNTRLSTIIPVVMLFVFSRVNVCSLLLVSKEYSFALSLLDCVPLTKKITKRTAVTMEMTATVTTTTMIIWVSKSRQGIGLQLCVSCVVLQESQVLFLARIPPSHV